MPKNAVFPRVSEHINAKWAQNLFRAFDYATDVLQATLNLYVVVRLRPSASASKATIFARVVHKFRDWHIGRLKQMNVTQKGLGPLYAVTFENPGDDHPHVNWAVWVHPSLYREFRRKLLTC